MKALILYKDWLLLNRGEIRPEVGDRYLYPSCAATKDGFSHYIITPEKLLLSDITEIVNLCYIEIDYNPNEAIEFANFIGNNFKKCMGKTTEELYKQFKQEKNEIRI